jgi:DNA mismatch repair protein MutS
MIYDDYIDYSKTYQEKYGERTIVFMQVGDFFEIYAVQNDDESVGADIYAVSDLCNIQVSRKNKSILENHRQNPLMAGFPLSIVSKHIQTLVGHGYTVVVIRQVTPPPNPRREVTEIISPSTHIQPQGADHTYLMVLYWEYVPVAYGATRYQWTVGMAAVDITTGDVTVAEALPRTDDRHFAKDEAYRWIQMLQPRELLMAGETTPHLLRELQLDILHPSRKVHSITASDSANASSASQPPYHKLAYQEQLFQKLYGSTTPCSNGKMIEHLGLERSDNIRIALAHAIQFVFEHNEQMLKAMKPPKFLKLSDHCCVHYNALLQLNVLSHTPGERPLLTLLNRCSTAFGSRLFKERLLNPLIHKSQLEQRYRCVEEWMARPDLPALKKHFHHILDLERFARRVILGQLAPCEWVPIAQSLHHATQIVAAIQDNACIASPTLATHLATVQTVIADTLLLEEAGKYWMNDIRGSVFQTGLYPELDASQATVQSALQRLSDLAAAISDEGFCKMESNDRYGHYLTMTKKRWEAASASASASTPPPGTQWKEFKTTALSSSSSIVRITHPLIDTLSHTLAAEQKKLGGLATECYRRFLETIGEHVATALEQAAAILGDMDVQLTNARNALDFCYTRPNVSINTNHSKSFLDAKQMRHPIIERLQTQTPYVPNDVTLGTHNTDGWLLYGINAAGKSSLMKAIGLNVLMAQAGMYVPCAALTYEPYDYIFTRISGADNIYRGMSSFTVEITELRNILMRCNARSLVLGDELCAGTESLSALSIVAAGVETLAETQASFVFATHLHELVSLGTLPSNVSIFHIHIEMDPETQTITYDRHLTPGVGHSHYGLEVCRALALPDAFLKRAHAYRRKIQDEPQTFMNTKPSNYNKSLFVDRCALCSSPATETHHIRYQRDATASRSKKHIQHIPVHSTQNLVPLCDACHLKEHHGELHIHGFQQTSAGRTLKVSYSPSPTPNQNLDKTSR